VVNYNIGLGWLLQLQLYRKNNPPLLYTLTHHTIYNIEQQPQFITEETASELTALLSLTPPPPTKPLTLTLL
jgi:hypothetical protein